MQLDDVDWTLGNTRCPDCGKTFEEVGSRCRIENLRGGIELCFPCLHEAVLKRHEAMNSLNNA